MRHIKSYLLLIIVTVLGILLWNHGNILENTKDIKIYRQTKEVTLIATGDVMLGRSVNTQTLKYKDFDWAFRNIKELLSSGDITLINLEGPLTKNCPPRNDGMVFCGDIRNITGLRDAGVDIANIANNHAYNYGSQGMEDTRQALKSANIEVSGDENILYKTVGSETWAFLGYNDIGPKEPGISWANKELIAQQVKEAKSKAQVVVVSLHAGNEYTQVITARQKELAHTAIDNGADLIIGHHPHWVQPTERYKDKLIVYSHGNLIFDQMWSTNTRQGVVGKYTFNGGKLIKTEWVPIIIEDYGQPRITSETRVLQQLEHQL